MKPDSWKSIGPAFSCSDTMLKWVIWRWFSFRLRESKSLTPLTVRPSPGELPDTFGIWNWLREVPRIRLTRVVGSMIPEI